jgi:chemotaxis protein CheX
MAEGVNTEPVAERERNILSGQAPGSTVSPLPQILDLTAAKPLRDRLEALLSGRAVIVDAGAVERMSTPCAQVLLAAARTASSAEVSFRSINASAVFRTALDDLSLNSEFTKWMD